MTRLYLACLLCLMFTEQVLAVPQPADAIRLANQDIKTVAPDDQPYTRYLWLTDATPARRKRTWLATAGLVNSLSLSRRIVSPVLVAADSSIRDFRQIVKEEEWGQVVLLRINLRDYRQTPQQWDKAANPVLEPLFHVFTKVPYDKGTYKYKDGRDYPAGEERMVAFAPWLIGPLNEKLNEQGFVPERLKELIELVVLTGYSPAPVVEARNWVWMTAIDFDRGEVLVDGKEDKSNSIGYYSWLGIKDQKSFEKLVRINRDVRALREAVSRSGIANEARAVDRFGRNDGAWYTYDQVNQRGRDRRNPLNFIDRDELEFDATEAFGLMDNGWWAVALFTNKGVLQQSAPDGVGYNHKSLTNDGKIHVCLTCFGCHDAAAGNGGLQPFRPYFRDTYATPGPAALAFFRKGRDRKVAERLEEEYLTPLDQWADGDKRSYAAAVEQATGGTPQEWAAALVATFNSWDQAIGLEQAADEYGVKPDELVTALKVQMVATGQLDNVNVNWIKPKERRDSVTRTAFAENYNQGQLALRGIPVWPPELRKQLIPWVTKPKVVK